MERLVGKLTIVLLAAAVLTLLGARAPGAAGAGIDFRPCPESNALACGHLAVPLSPDGAVPGTVTLTIRRRRAPVGNPTSAVVALAGGPGQAAIPFTETFAELLGPIVSTRDLIVFDQRGTGLSGALRCQAFKHPSDSPPAQVVKRCAQQIGPGHGSYTTQETVADIEAVRIAGGYEKLVLYGTSYGTKVALDYAQEHPSHVEALVLDSVVEPNGPDPLHLGTFEAVPRVLRELCAFRGCAHLTSNPVADLRSVVRKMGRRGLRGTVIDGHGHPHEVRVSSAELFSILVEGDLDPLLRAEFPAAIRAAAEGDTALMARMLLHASGGEEEEPSSPGDPSFDNPLYYATLCEEERFPWSRTASPQQRLAEASAKIDALPASALAPFSSADVLPFSDMEECAAWPFTRPAPPVLGNGPMPAVPTLILSGAEDLRTPTSGAQAVAATIPGAHLLVVPNTGHSVLTTEPEECALSALHALFAGKAIKTCRATPPPPFLKPIPLAPRHLSQIEAAHGYTGRAGRTLAAVGLTFADMSRQVDLAILSEGFKALASRHGLHVGGLRGGWASFTPRHLRIMLHHYTYVPGVEVSGWLGYEQGELRIGGRATAVGVLRLVKRHYVGELGGADIDVSVKALSAQIASGRRSTLTLPPRLARQPAARTLEQIGGLAQTLGGPAGTGALQAIAYALTHASAHRDPLR